MARSKRIIIIGGNAAGMAAAMQARRNDSSSEITILEQSSFISTASCSIPEYLSGDVSDLNALLVMKADVARDKYKLNVFLRHRVEAIEPAKGQILVQNQETGQKFGLTYDRLVLATGAKPIQPDWLHHKVTGVFTLRTIEDALQIRTFVSQRRPQRMIILGTGTIAQICSSSLKNSVPNIKLIGLKEGLMEDLEEPISQRLSEVLTSNGVTNYFTDNISGIKVSHDNMVMGVKESEVLHEADMLLIAIGVHPNTDLAIEAGVRLGKTGAISVDRTLLTNKNNIFACGDCAETFCRLTRKPIYWPLATTAARQGRQAGESVTSGSGKDAGSLQMRLWTCFGLEIGRVGLSVRQAKEYDIKAEMIAVRADTTAHLKQNLDLVIIFNTEEQIIGAQAAGNEGVLARMNVLSTAIEGKLKLRDLERLDLGYTPKLSTLWDAVQIAGRQGSKKAKLK